jgi:hemoglobin-like flavoprotein
MSAARHDLQHQDPSRIVEPTSETRLRVRDAQLTAEDLDAIDASYERLAPLMRAIAIEVWNRIEQGSPALAPHLRRDDAEQRRLSLSLFGFVVRNLRSPDRLGPLLENMGERGMPAGIADEALDDVGRALLSTLREADASGWTVATASAWTKAYRWCASHVLRGAVERRRSAH